MGAKVMSIDSFNLPVRRGRKPYRERLSPAENKVLSHIVDGYELELIGDLLGIAEKTVRHHVRQIMKKKNIQDHEWDRFITNLQGAVLGFLPKGRE